MPEQGNTSLSNSAGASVGIGDAATVDDLLGFKEAAHLIADSVARVDLDKTPWTIGVFGEWGSGKTSFLRMIDQRLRSLEHRIEPIWFNAWRYSHEEKLWTALIQTVLDQMRVTGPWWRRPVVTLRVWYNSLDLRAGGWELFKRLGAFAARLAFVAVAFSLIFNAITGRSSPTIEKIVGTFAGPITSTEAASSSALQLALAGLALLASKPDYLWKVFDIRLGIDFAKFSKRRSYRDRIAFLDEFDEQLRDLVRIAGGGRPIVIVIDDLDRCLPEQTLQVIEAIKLFLEVRGCVFLLAIDHEIVEQAIASRYKEHTSSAAFGRLGETYLEKIVQLPVSIPPASRSAAVAFIRNKQTIST